MRFIAAYIMRGRLPSVLVTSVFALLSLLLPPLVHLSGAAVGLVSLRKGGVEGLVLTLAASLVSGVFASFVLGSPMLGAIFAFMVWLPMVLLGEVLRRSVSLSVALSTVVGLVGSAVVGFYLFVDSPAQWWQQYLSLLSEEVMAQAATPAGWEASIAAMSQVMTGIIAAAIGLSLVTNLLIARWWQALLFNEGGFRREFYALRLQRGLVWASLLMALFALLGGEVLGQLAINLLLVLLLLFLLQATAVVHALVAAREASSAWLVVFYVALFIFPQVAALLVLVGISDSWVDYRHRMGRQGSDNGA